MACTLTCSAGVQLSIVPLSTQPNSVSSATGVPVGPVRRPFSKTSTKMSTPSRMSTRPGSPKLGSAKGRSEICFQDKWIGDLGDDPAIPDHARSDAHVEVPDLESNAQK